MNTPVRGFLKAKLREPGGVVQAMALKIGHHMNAEKFRKYELEFEKYLHTIRIVRVKR